MPKQEEGKEAEVKVELPKVPMTVAACTGANNPNMSAERLQKLQASLEEAKVEAKQQKKATAKAAGKAKAKAKGKAKAEAKKKQKPAAEEKKDNELDSEEPLSEDYEDLSLIHI